MIDIAARQPSFLVATIAILGLAILLALALRSVPRRWLAVGGFVIAATLGSALVNGSDSTQVLLDPNSATRYFVFAWFVIGSFLIVSASRRNPAAIVLLCVLAIGIVGDFRLPSSWNLDWSANAACVGGPDPCDVKIFPGIPYWTLSWPGLAAIHDLPAP